ncbi:hypothetical protein B484DRAFT_447593 [Ochromonadaceae sp. CCMP2298]|nr:hypothetical protein B484DRAFT_447593 [Ochromonadaceae sp. CCMP2298]|mmetsp:Transcript_32827/g.72274  ORF Transcript_32827/g.72274 Transcript_32827/m.72274 type:complete len:306 (+) Transcript_32827:59-976(+)
MVSATINEARTEHKRSFPSLSKTTPKQVQPTDVSDVSGLGVSALSVSEVTDVADIAYVSEVVEVAAAPSGLGGLTPGGLTRSVSDSHHISRLGYSQGSESSSSSSTSASSGVRRSSSADTDAEVDADADADADAGSARKRAKSYPFPSAAASASLSTSIFASTSAPASLSTSAPASAPTFPSSLSISTAPHNPEPVDGGARSGALGDGRVITPKACTPMNTPTLVKSRRSISRPPLRFHSLVEVIGIPTREEYVTAGCWDQIWHLPSEIEGFKWSARQELLDFVRGEGLAGMNFHEVMALFLQAA